MRRTVLAAVAVLGLSELAPARAQPFVPPGHARFRFGLAVGPPVFPVAGFAGGFYARSVWAVPYPGVPVYGYGGPYLLAPPVVVVPPPVVVVAGGDAGLPPDNALGPPPPRRGDFLVIAPQKNVPPPAAGAEERTIPHLDRIAQPPKAVGGPAFAFDPFAKRPPEKPNPEKPEADPAAEAARLVRLAREAFAAEHYGRAAERLDAASAVRPADPLPYFLRAQARFAAGQYADAVASIREGMKRAPDWPAGDFKPRELYGPRPERFDTHLAELRQAVKDNPADAGLAFLLGYELWFAGDRAEAVRLLRDAAKRGRDGAIVERFLREAEKAR